MRRLALISLLVFAGLVVGAGGPVRAPAGSAALAIKSLSQPPAVISSIGVGEGLLYVSGPQVALDGRGDATVVWELVYAAQTVAMEADWTANGRWTAAQRLWTVPAVTLGSGPGPLQLAVNARGDAILVWTEQQAGVTGVRAAFRPPGQRWQPARTVSVPGEQAGPLSLRVALDNRGRALVAWGAARGSVFRVEVAARTRAGVWSKPRPRILCTCSWRDVELAMNASGQALVLWSDGGLWVEARSPQGHWSARQRISSLGTGGQLALNANGAAVASWVEYTDSPQPRLVVDVRPAHGRFGPQQVIGAFYWGFALTLAPTGEAVVMWADADAALHAMARLPGARSFTPTALVAQAGWQTFDPVLGMDARGNTHALWMQSPGTTPALGGDIYVHTAQRPAGGSFDSGSDLADIGPDSYKHVECGGQPAIATTANGDAVAVWLSRHPSDLQCTSVDAAAFNH